MPRSISEGFCPTLNARMWNPSDRNSSRRAWDSEAIDWVGCRPYRIFEEWGYVVSGNDQYPHTLKEIRGWHGSQGESGRSILDDVNKVYKSLFSKKQTEEEYRIINDNGGYFYDPNTGEIRLNLNRPVKEYIQGYTGKYRDDIPSRW